MTHNITLTEGTLKFLGCDENTSHDEVLLRLSEAIKAYDILSKRGFVRENGVVEPCIFRTDAAKSKVHTEFFASYPDMESALYEKYSFDTPLVSFSHDDVPNSIEVQLRYCEGNDSSSVIAMTNNTVIYEAEVECLSDIRQAIDAVKEYAIHDFPKSQTEHEKTKEQQEPELT